MVRMPYALNARSLSLVALLSLVIALCSTEARATLSPENRKSSSLLLDKRFRAELLPLGKDKEKKSTTFDVHEEPGKRFKLLYEETLEKKEASHKVMENAREAIGRVEARLGKFKGKFLLVVADEINGIKYPYTSIGTFDEQSAVFVTYNGTTTEVMGHGFGMLRIEEINPKCPSWLKVGAARSMTAADGFDEAMFKVLEKSDGVVPWKKAKSILADEKTAIEDRRAAIASGWALAYYLTEVSTKPCRMVDVLKMKSDEYPDSEKVWSEVLKYREEQKKK